MRRLNLAQLLHLIIIFADYNGFTGSVAAQRNETDHGLTSSRFLLHVIIIEGDTFNGSLQPRFLHYSVIILGLGNTYNIYCYHDIRKKLLIVWDFGYRYILTWLNCCLFLIFWTYHSFQTAPVPMFFPKKLYQCWCQYGRKCCNIWVCWPAPAFVNRFWWEISWYRLNNCDITLKTYRPDLNNTTDVKMKQWVTFTRPKNDIGLFLSYLDKCKHFCKSPSQWIVMHFFVKKKKKKAWAHSASDSTSGPFDYTHHQTEHAHMLTTLQV